MNSKRSYLEIAQCRSTASGAQLDGQLNRSLETLEQRIGRNATDCPTGRLSPPP